MAGAATISPNDPTLTGVIARVRRRGFRPGSIISIGAGRGDDAPWFHQQWPEARQLLIDADSRFEQGYVTLAAADSLIAHEICFAGDENRTARIHKSGLVGGVIETPSGSEIPMWRLDDLAEKHRLHGPYFVRFDTNGAEVEILRGAERILQNTGLIMMEVYNFKLQFMKGRNLTFYEMAEYMRSLGFGVVDICDQLNRPVDGALWQFHMFFSPLADNVFKRLGYSG